MFSFGGDKKLRSSMDFFPIYLILPAAPVVEPLTEMSSGHLPGCIAWCKADKLTAICEPIVQKMWDP
jgi:hypothetical protein